MTTHKTETPSSSAGVQKSSKVEPTVGRIVSYHQSGHGLPSPVAAIITEVYQDEKVGLTVFAPGASSQPKMGVRHGADKDNPEAPYWEWNT